MDLPEVFKDFCTKNEINPEIYDHPQRQYFFTKESIDGDAVSVIGGAVRCKLLDNFYQISTDNFQFSRSKLYEEGKLLPMDLSSGMAVHLLDIKPSDHILDLCCAPGGKLVLSALLQGSHNFSVPETVGTLTGVDLAAHRLATCRSLIKKYHVQCARLFCADGTSFNEPVCEFSNRCGERINQKSRPFHETTAFRKRPNKLAECAGYDKVLVDAQCTHDGSIKHIRKHRQNNWEGFDLTQFEPENLRKLHTLQFGLLENGFKLLKPGGILVYSTCSLSRGQNEDIICKFLKEHSDAIPMPFEGSDEFGQLRLSPPHFDSGFFICRLSRKLN